jgi:glutathione S-transferase
MGRTPEEKGVVADLQWRIESDGLAAVGEALRNATPGMKGRALTGPHSYEQIPELAERGKLRTERFMPTLDTIIGEKPFVAGDAYSVADIDALVFVEFAKWVKVGIPEDCTNLKRWYESIAARPSSKL